jgi:hypothetical protein
MSRFVAQKKFCKVCKDAGKSESEYTSHYTRESSDPNSRVICPTLLSQECRFCHKLGHTTKYCPILKEKERMQKRQEYHNASKRVVVAEVPKKSNKTPTNVFASLFDSDSEEEKTQKVELFPALCPVPQAKVSNLSYASALAKPIEKPAIVAKLAPIITKPEPQDEEDPKTSRPKIVLAPWANDRNALKRSFWDEESEDDMSEVSEDEVPPSYDVNDSFSDEEFSRNYSRL